MHPRVAELRELFRRLCPAQPRRLKSTENIFVTYAYGARATGLSMTTMYRWKREFADFPKTPLLRTTLERYIRRKRLERWDGMARLKAQARVLALRNQGHSPAEIIAMTGLSRSAMYRKLKAAKQNISILAEMRLLPAQGEGPNPSDRQ